MKIIIHNANNKPIYEQIYQQIKNEIICGNFEEDTPLPSMRTLAKDLRISVITTKRAYEELEKDGYIYTVAGKGCYVAKKNMAIIREEHLKQIEDYMQKILQLAPACELSPEDLIEMFRTLQEEESTK